MLSERVCSTAKCSNSLFRLQKRGRFAPIDPGVWGPCFCKAKWVSCLGKASMLYCVYSTRAPCPSAARRLLNRLLKCIPSRHRWPPSGDTDRKAMRRLPAFWAGKPVLCLRVPGSRSVRQRRSTAGSPGMALLLYALSLGGAPPQYKDEPFASVSTRSVGCRQRHVPAWVTLGYDRSP